MERRPRRTLLRWAGRCNLACGVVALIMILLFSRAVIAWGVFGAFIVLAAALLLFAWIFDRRQAREI